MVEEKDLITETIEDVDKSTSAYIKKRPLAVLLFGVAPLTLVFWLIYKGYDSDPTAILFIIPIFAWMYVRSRMSHIFMQQFARANNFTYAYSGSLVGLDGALFEKGNGRKLTDVVSGAYKDNPIRIFYYEFSTGSGKNRQHYPYTICEIEYKGALPSVSVEEAGFWDANEFLTHGQKKLQLHNEFDKHFTLYVQSDYEIEALEIFTPEVAEALIRKAKSFEFGFHGCHLYIYSCGKISTRKRLEELRDLMRYIVETLSPRIVRLHDDVSAMHEVYAKHGA
ncbi:MAG: hypothetical protein A3G60_00885 [Candidatus Ryanbacteria bacterium RIFCSPLOWO2_12_FULL_47_9c]|uniref:DUF3137 domain-containing protein n=1 Tax=Candidatus Ryanbacteria bacterium RIFCSPLOWO2_12_FULL_47_9c TaxID=1802131 RepID=A0A1G2H641_9BACT|nr:MAG: hypothetical protein A3G60_00885 [Candidatus Ryanbacteria bacterium RIFCSPLOWO2_12_FULL_47_9c]